MKNQTKVQQISETAEAMRDIVWMIHLTVKVSSLFKIIQKKLLYRLLLDVDLTFKSDEAYQLSRFTLSQQREFIFLFRETFTIS